SPVVRSLLSRATGRAPAASENDHKKLAEYWKTLDGATSPTKLQPEELRAWCEKVHHISQSGDQADAWDEFDLVAPNFYWDRGRYLSITKKNYRLAAEVYRRCVAR